MTKDGHISQKLEMLPKFPFLPAIKSDSSKNITILHSTYLEVLFGD